MHETKKTLSVDPTEFHNVQDGLRSLKDKKRPF